MEFPACHGLPVQALLSFGQSPSKGFYDDGDDDDDNDYDDDDDDEEKEDVDDDLGRDYDRRPTSHLCFRELPLQILSLVHGQTTL